MIFDILTIFPGLFESMLNESIVKRAREKGRLVVNLTDIRNFADDKHAMTDDRPFGGGEGMVMKADPLSAALKSLEKIDKRTRVVLLSPQGNKYTQAKAVELAHESQLILICGRYEGVDERFCQQYVTEELSIGDYVLTGGELAAMVVIDSIARLLPGVLGCSASAENDTFSRNLLKHPQYTRPRSFEGVEVPEELLSGNHKKIEEYRFIESVKRTLSRRPELLIQETFSPKEVKLLRAHGLLDRVIDVQKGQGN